MPGSKALRAAAKLWYVRTLDVRSAVPVPRDSHDVLSGAEDADRVLLIGNGATHGWGTLTHELALTGQLGRALTRRTGRGTDVRYVGDEMMSLAAVLPWLGDCELGGFDLVLVVLSMNDALRLTPVDEYTAEMVRVLDRLTAETRPSARIVVAGIHAVDALPLYRGVVARVAQRSADRLNAAVRGLVGRYDGVEFMDLPAPTPEPGRPSGSPAMYAEWSEVFAQVCAPALDTARALDPAHAPVPAAPVVWDWAPAERIVEGAPPEGWERLNRLVASAKDALGTDVAFVSVIDGGQQYFAANTIGSGRSVPLELTHCSVTVRGDEPLIVRDATRDDRLPNTAFTDVTQIRYYAGVPLKNEEGRNIGTFCVASALPTGGRRVTEASLLEYAARAQQELQRLAADRTGDEAEHRSDASAAS